MCFLIDMVNVSLELKDPKGKEGAGSLARYGCDYTVLLLVMVVEILYTSCCREDQRWHSSGSQLNLVCLQVAFWLVCTMLFKSLNSSITQDS